MSVFKSDVQFALSSSTQLPAQCPYIVNPRENSNRLQPLFKHAAEQGSEKSLATRGYVTAFPAVLGHQHCYVSLIYMSCVGELVCHLNEILSDVCSN